MPLSDERSGREALAGVLICEDRLFRESGLVVVGKGGE